MYKSLLFLAGAFILLLSSCTEGQEKTVTKKDANGYEYSEVKDDPTKTRIYTLENGLQVYLSVNKDEPRIMTNIAVRAGSVNDPVETTGLAHYFEHMMFKGTAKFGTKDWEKEKVLIQKISDTFEAHRAEQDLEKKKVLYKKIDSLSYEASKYAIPNEYDKLCSLMGATKTNAGTSWEYTVYINEIPSNELDRWLTVERERFDRPVLRLLHTELETVYEEFNMSQDKDSRRQFNTMMEAMFPTHPLGRSILGFPKDLKNPSMENIMEFFDNWYVPNNMAIILSGDIDFDETIKKIDAQFGNLEAKALPELELPKEAPMTEDVAKHITGPNPESIYVALRTPGHTSDDAMYYTLLDYLLANSTAGLIDLNLNQQQKVLYAGSYTYFLKDYGMHVLYGAPRQGQTLDDVRDLLLAQIDSLKTGAFDEWMIKAAVNDMRLSKIREYEGNGRVNDMLDAFIGKEDWAEKLAFFDEMEKLTKDELVAFANEHYNYYVTTYKHQGAAEGLVKMDKPQITPIVINRSDKSEFVQEFEKIDVESIKPVFVDFEKEIQTTEFNEHTTFSYIENKSTELFKLNYIVEIGKSNDLLLPLAVGYLPYLGTDKYSAQDIQKEFYKLGIKFDVRSGSKRSYLFIDGLEKNMEAGLALLEHLMANAKVDEVAYQNYVNTIFKSRSDAKKNPKSIQSALFNYGKFGKESSFTNIIPNDELMVIDPNKLVEKIKQFSNYPHTIFYYGTKSMDQAKDMVAKFHKAPETWLSIPKRKEFKAQAMDKSKVYFVNYDKSQVDVFFVGKDEKYDQETYVASNMFNAYYGGGMSSIVFQEIREARALAYSAWAGYSRPSSPKENFYVQGLVYTQADKLMDAVDAMGGLLTEMVVNETTFDFARENVLKNTETNRIIKDAIYWTYLSNKDFGIKGDIRKQRYEAAKTAKLEDVQQFFNDHVANKPFTYMISGNKQNLDLKAIGKIAPLTELTLEEIFGY